MTDAVETVSPEQEQQAMLLVFSNHKNNDMHMQSLKGLLKMAYHTVLTNRLAVMQAFNTETGAEEVILVGVDQNGNGIECYPLFAPLRAEDVTKYQAPDGAGGWITPNPDTLQ